VLSLGNEQPDVRLPQQGSTDLTEHIGKEATGRYVLTASYTDRGGAIQPLTRSDVLVLRPARVQAGDADVREKIEKQRRRLGNAKNGAHFGFKNIDLTGINALTYHYASKDRDATLELHLDAPDGPVVSTLNYSATGDWKTYADQRVPLKPTTGRHDLYFVLRKAETPDDNLISLDWIEFGK